MTGRIVYQPSVGDLHEREGCTGLPDAEAYPRGTRWQCDDCGQQWVVVEGAQYNEPYTAWRRLTARNRDGLE